MTSSSRSPDDDVDTLTPTGSIASHNNNTHGQLKQQYEAAESNNSLVAREAAAHLAQRTWLKRTFGLRHSNKISRKDKIKSQLLSLSQVEEAQDLPQGEGQEHHHHYSQGLQQALGHEHDDSDDFFQSEQKRWYKSGHKKQPPPMTPASPTIMRKAKSIMSLRSLKTPAAGATSGNPDESLERQQQDVYSGQHPVDHAAQKQQPKSHVAVDVLWECQRGLILFGLPTFSSSALLNFDPQTWVYYAQGQRRNSPYTRLNFPLPSPQWRWLDPAFLINMAADAAVDEQGWSYAFSFANARHWSGHSKWYTFVRRRQWVRTRIKAADAMPADHVLDNHPDPTPHPSSPLIGLSESPAVAPTKQQQQQQSNRPRPVLTSSCPYTRLPVPQWEQERLFQDEVSSLDFRDPFLRWSDIKQQGSTLLFRRLDQHNEPDARDEAKWRDAVVEINLRRAMHCLKSAKVDRERCQLWKHWLGAEVLVAGETLGTNGSVDASLSASHHQASGVDELLEDDQMASVDDGDVEDVPRPLLSDVWDLVEAKLDDLLLAFHYQSARSDLLELLKEQHPPGKAVKRLKSFDRSSHPLPDEGSAQPQIDWSDFQAHHIMPRIAFGQPEPPRPLMLAKTRRDASFATAHDTSFDSTSSEDSGSVGGTSAEEEEEEADEDEDSHKPQEHMLGSARASPLPFSASPMPMEPNSVPNTPNSKATSYFDLDTQRTPSKKPAPLHLSAKASSSLTGNRPRQASILQNEQDPATRHRSGSPARSISFAAAPVTSTPANRPSHPTISVNSSSNDDSASV